MRALNIEGDKSKLNLVFCLGIYALNSLTSDIYKISSYSGEFIVMSTNYDRKEGPIYVGETVKLLGNIPLFIYHIPVDEALIDELVDNSRVRVLLIGNNQSVDFFDKKCPQNRGEVTIDQYASMIR